MLPLILVSKSKKDTDEFVKSFIKTHNIPKNEIFKIYPQKNGILISQVREIKQEILIASTLPRLFVLYDFDHATTEAQNALLKSLEEAQLNIQFILVVKNEYFILPTVTSRSKIVRLNKDNLIKDKKYDRYREFLSTVEKSLNYRFLADATLTGVTKEDVAIFLEGLIAHYRAKLVSAPESVKILKKTLSLKLLLENNNLNPQLTLDILLIFIFKTFRMKT